MVIIVVQATAFFRGAAALSPLAALKCLHVAARSAENVQRSGGGGL